MFLSSDLDAPRLELPLLLSSAACGFTSPAEGCIEQTGDLNQLSMSEVVIQIRISS